MQDLEKDMELARQYDSKALERLGLAYYNGNGVEQDRKKAFELFVASTWEGNINAAFRAGLCYLNGEGVEKNLDFALAYFQYGGRHGDPRAQYYWGAYLTNLDLEGQSNFPQNVHVGNNFLQRAAESGNIEAMVKLAENYFEGVGGIFDMQVALYWYEKAAEQGNVVAMYNCGVLYHGQCCPYISDVNKAGMWFNEAAKRGHRDAQSMVKQYTYSGFSKKWKMRG